MSFGYYAKMAWNEVSITYINIDFMDYLFTKIYGISPRFYAELEQPLVHRNLKEWKRARIKSVPA